MFLIYICGISSCGVLLIGTPDVLVIKYSSNIITLLKHRHKVSYLKLKLILNEPTTTLFTAIKERTGTKCMASFKVNKPWLDLRPS